MKKICVICNNLFFDNTKRKLSKTCSKNCAYQFGVQTRKQKGSYKRTKKQNDKLSKTIKTLHEQGLLKISQQKKEKLSILLSERVKSLKYKDRIKQISKEKYGVDHYTQAKSVLKKKKDTNIKLYGFEYPTKNIDIVNKILETKKQNGIIKLHNGLTMKEWSESINISYSYFKEIVNKEGFEIAKRLCKQKTLPESIIEDFLQKNNINYDYDSTKFGIYRPDFLIENKRIIIETDGLYWHSDKIQKDKFYHQNKKNYFNNLNYEVLFFRSNELENKKDIVFSILENKLNLIKNKIYARKCSLIELNKKQSKDFFNTNHLMGIGKGTTYALIYNKNIVAAMQICWNKKESKEIEISRFCNSLHTNVIGGFSKLLKRFEKNLNPVIIKTYIDCRYGSGNYLHLFGFKEMSNNLSFCWTNGKVCLHRMKYKNNSGYEFGFNKIWDCGQKKYIKQLRKNE